MVNSQEDERARVAQELHDGIIQVLVSTLTFLEIAQLQLGNSARNQPTDNKSDTPQQDV